jgi:chemotaxis protein histidine kinase CheA
MGNVSLGMLALLPAFSPKEKVNRLAGRGG